MVRLSLKQFPISISARSGSRGLYLFGDRPDEARQLTRDRGSDHRRLLSCPGELAIPSAQPLLATLGLLLVFSRNCRDLDVISADSNNAVIATYS